MDRGGQFTEWHRPVYKYGRQKRIEKFSSMHPTVMNFAHADGSVKAVAQDVDGDLLVGLSSIAGNEILARRQRIEHQKNKLEFWRWRDRSSCTLCQLDGYLVWLRSRSSRQPPRQAASENTGSKFNAGKDTTGQIVGYEFSSI